MANLRKLRNRMKEKKGLSLVYALKEYDRCFTFDDIKAAFNAGRKSVFDSFPKLLFKEVQEGLVAVANLFEKLYHVYKSASVEEPQYTFAFDYEMPIQWHDTLEEAMDAANEDYKKRIKQALGL